MKAYELLFFIDPSLDEETRIATMKRVDNAITNDGGTIDSVEDWGKRRLAYEVKDLTEGSYTLINFHMDPAALKECDRVLRITDAVARFMIVRRDDLE
jgi:small subunit ribosomal protein S6